MALQIKTTQINNPPPLHKVRAACEPADKTFYLRYKELGGGGDWTRADQLAAIRVLSSLEDDLELEQRPDNHKRAQQKSMQRVRRLLEQAVGDVVGRKLELRKKFPMAESWLRMPN